MSGAGSQDPIAPKASLPPSLDGTVQVPGNAGGVN